MLPPTYIKILLTHLRKANIPMTIITFFVHLPASLKLEAKFCPTYNKIHIIIAFFVHLPDSFTEGASPFTEGASPFPTIT